MYILLIEKLKDSGLAFSELPKVRTVRKKKTSTSSALDGDSSTIEEVSPGSGCASRLLAINGVGPRAVEALLSYATAVETVELVEGLLQHVTFTSTTDSSVMTGTTAVAQALTVSTTTSTRTSPECDPAPAIKKPAPADLPLAGRVVVFTGKLESGMPRHDAKALCTLLGECVSAASRLYCSSRPIRGTTTLMSRNIDYFGFTASKSGTFLSIEVLYIPDRPSVLYCADVHIHIYLMLITPIYVMYCIMNFIGGTARSSMNKSVNLLIHAGSNRSSKMTKAAELGIEVWSEHQWSEFIEKYKVI